MPSFSLARTHRLSKKAEFAAVFEEQLKVSQAWFLTLYKNSQKTHPRIGIIVSKRILKKAVARNHLKRLLREGFRQHCSQMKTFDFVILVRKGCNLENKVKLKKELDTLWQRLLSL